MTEKEKMLQGIIYNANIKKEPNSLIVGSSLIYSIFYQQ